MVPLVCKERKGKFQDYSNQANHYKYLFLQRCKSTVDTSTVKNCTQTLMEWKRGWHPSLNNATEGLSPFCVLELSMDEVATINDRYDTLKKASAVTVGDVDKAKASVKASVPDTADEFITLLKQYANLLFALFLGDCPLFKCVANVVNCIRNYSLAARKAMTKASNVSILWIIFLQSRKFAIREFEILAEFTSIQALLCKKNPIIRHVEVPDALWNKKKRKGDTEDVNPKDPNISKQQTTERKNPNCWHSVLKAKLGPAMKQAGYPSLSQVLKYCDKADARDIFPNSTRICAPNSFLGQRGYKEKCNKKHDIPMDAEVERILKMVDKFIKNPLGAKEGQS